jgi:hypothetical protein
MLSGISLKALQVSMSGVHSACVDSTCQLHHATMLQSKRQHTTRGMSHES